MKLLITALCALAFALAPALNVKDSLNRKSDEATFTHQTETTENNYKADNLLSESVLKEENVSVLSDDGADKENNNDFIKWVDFKVPYEVLKKNYELYKSALAEGLPCMAECGGFMYLMDYFRAKNGEKFAWVGAVSGETYMTERLNRFGYVTLTAKRDNLLCKAGEGINGHEFHYSDSTNNGDTFAVAKASGTKAWEAVYTTPNLYAGYPHVHLWGNPQFAQNFVKACEAYKNK